MENETSTIVIFVGAIAATILLVLIILLAIVTAKRRRADRLKQEKADREAMLRILPQLSLYHFKLVIKNLGWVKRHETDLSNTRWLFNLPPASYGDVELIGATIGSVVKKWHDITEEPDTVLSNLASLAKRVFQQYDEEDRTQFIVGMKKSNREAGDEVERLLKEVIKAKEVEIDDERKNVIVNTGIAASARFIQ